MSNLLWSLLIALVIVAAWVGYSYWRLRRAATLVSSAEFSKLMHAGQVIDVREPDAFREKHILGARNIPYSQWKQSISAIRKDQPVLLYEGELTSRVVPAATYLKKKGYKNLYILDGGIKQWNGKFKGQDA